MKNENTNTQALIMATVKFSRFTVTKKATPLKTVNVNGDLDIDQTELGRISARDKSVKISFENLTILKQNNERTRVNGEIKIITGEETLEEAFKDIMKHF